MKQKWYWTILLAGLLAIGLAACIGNTENAEPTPAENTDPTSDEAESETITLFVGSELVECTGVAPQMCMLVREDPSADYTFFYGQIEGFTFEPGYEYELLVQVETIENPPADGSSLKYTLVEEVSRTAVSEAGVETAAGDDPLANSNWTLVSYTDANGAATPVAPNSEITLAFKDGGIAGSAGCNNYFGSYTVDGSNLTFGMIGSTEMACMDGAITTQESAYLAALSMVSQYQLDGTNLVLTDKDGNTLLTFTAQIPVSLTGTVWQAIAVNNGREAVVGVLAEAPITAVFGEDGSLSGSGGCNNYNTTYTTDGNNITINGQIASTMMACEEAVSTQEAAYLAALPQAATYTITGDRLELRSATGSLLADYMPMPQTSLTDNPWLATSYRTTNAIVGVSSGMRLTAVFAADGTISGSGGCNNFTGPYTTDGSNISIGPLASTMMACAEAVMQQESDYLAALQAAATYQISGDALNLFTAEGTFAATFVVEPAQTLAGSSWDVTSINNGNQAVVSLIIGTELTANFGEDGTLSGSAGCNNYTTTFTADDQNITIGPAASTRMFCEAPEGVMEQEAQYLAALSTAVTYSINGPRMEMRTADGAMAATFQIAGFVDPEITAFLSQASYKLDMAATGTVTLTDGFYTEPMADGSASELTVSLTDYVAVGDLNGQFAVAAVITADPGGSGTFYYLSLFTAGDSGLVNTSTILIGDRVVINAIDITQNTVVLDMVQAGPDDALCCPTEHVMNVYELQGSELVLASSTPVEE